MEKKDRTVSIRLERASETFRRFDVLRKRLGYMTLKAGLLAAMNHMLMHYETPKGSSRSARC